MEFVPSNIIKTPDFGSMAQDAMNQKRQDINEMNTWMDSNKKKEGAYLEGDKPAVQEAWNKYQEELDRAVESGNRDARRKADEAYGSYVQVAGTALSLADQYRSQVAAYKTDPSKFSISGQEFLSMTDQYRRTRRNSNDIAEAAQNPFVIAQSMKYDLSNPLDQAGKMVQMSAARVKDFYDAQGNLDTDGVRRYAEELATATINANETSLEKAMAWGGVRSGYAGGEDGMINTMEELEFLRNQPEEKRQEFIDSYKNELVNNYINLLSNNKREDSGKKKLATDSISLQAAGGENVDFITLPGTLKTTYNVDNKDGTKSSVKGDIIQIGAAPNGELFVTIEREVDTDDYNELGERIKESTIEYRPATQTEVSKVMSKYGNTYDFSALNRTQEESQAQTAEQPAAGEQKAQGEEPAAGVAAEQPAENPNDPMDLKLFDTPEATEAEATAEESPAEKAPYVPEGVEAQADATLDRISKGVSAQELEDDKPYMLKEAQKIQSDIKQTRKEIAEAEKNGEDTAELNEKLDEQKRVLKKVNEVNRKISERRGRRGFEQSLPELNVDGEQAPQAKGEEPADKTKEPAGEGEEYVMINGKPYYKKDYAAVAGNKTGRGNYPDTFEEYAEQQNAEILNTKDRPLTTMLDEAAVTAKRTERLTAKQPVAPTQAGMSPTLRIKNESGKVEESTALNSNTYYDNVLKYEGGVSTDPDDLAAGLTENQDAPKTKVNGKQRLQHTNKGVTYSVFKNWAKEKGIKQKDYHDRFLNLSDDETKDIIDSYTISVGADKLKSPALKAIFTQNAWGTGKVWAADFKSGRSPEYRAVLDWLQESTGMDFESTGRMSEEEAKAIEEFYNKDPKGFIETYTDKKIQHFKSLDTFDKHGRGWVRRANELRDQLIADL